MLTDSQQSPQRFDDGGQLATVELELGGMHCSACATRIQRSLVRLPAVASAAVNLATERAFVSYDPAETSTQGLCDAVARIGYSASATPERRAASSESKSDHWGLRSVISWPLSIAALVIALTGPELPATGWIVLALAATVEVVGGWPFVRNSVRLARHGATNMDTLITLGTLAALAVTSVVTIALDGRHIHIGGGGALAASLHGVMAPLIVSILATGRAVEARVRSRAARAMNSLMELRPPTARVIANSEDSSGSLVAPETVPVGALVRVHPNEVIPLDGTVTAGWSAIDESMLTGEPLPVEHGPGSSVTGGTRNGSGSLVVRVDVVASDSVLARLQRLVEDAQRDRAPLQRIADRISSVFVPAVLAGAAVTFLGWWLFGGSIGRASLSALAVLLVACPCAMGLAAPVAMMVGCGRASAMGMFVRGSDALERLAKVDSVVFDKTGTLTEARATVSAVIVTGQSAESEVLAWASAVEAHIDHPIALAIQAAGHQTRRASDVQSIPGSGVEGIVDGHRIAVTRLSGQAIPQDMEAAVRRRLQQGETLVAVERDAEVIGAIAVTTPLRPEARHAVERLRRMGIESAILSGDTEQAVRSIAEMVGIPSAVGALSAAEKVQAITRLRSEGQRVAMVGDGVNDAPALAAANIGCAIGSGSDAALANSEVALLRNDLEGIPDAIGLARSTYAIIVQNFGWAMGYNISALPLAAFGLLDPVIAAFAMGLSSVIVVMNSLRLARLNRDRIESHGSKQLKLGRRGLAASVLLPVVLFAGLTLVSQSVSPARGESLLPTLPSLTITQLPSGGSLETYFEPGGLGLNQWHVIFYGNRSELGTVNPVVTATLDGSLPEALRQLKLGPGHYTVFVELVPGRWQFHVVSPFGGRTVSLTIAKTVR